MTGFRSKFEARVAAVLPAGTEYECQKFSFPIADPGYRCRMCSSRDVIRTTTYVPDFKLPNGTWIEAKGKLTGANRRRLVAFKAFYPDKDLRIVFMANNKLSKTSKTRYLDWAAKVGIPASVFPKLPL